MKISTIITVYNLEKYIVETLESVFSQTRLPDEIIVVDDCSTDNSAEILQIYAKRIKYIRLLENSGVMTAFLTGIEAASGDVLSFLDGDDIWFPEKLAEIEKAFIEDENRILVTHDYECINGEGNARLYSSDRTHFNTQRIVNEANGDANEMDKLLRNSILCLKGVWMGSAFCIRAKNFDLEKFKKFIFDSPDARFTHQDQPTAAFLLLENPDKKVFFIDKILFKYRIFDQNSSGSSSDINSALKTINRSVATISRTSLLVAEHPELTEENKWQKLKLAEMKYLQNLYNGKFLDTAKLFLNLSRHFWTFRQFSKELQRFAGVTILGIDKFLKIKSKY